MCLSLPLRLLVPMLKSLVSLLVPHCHPCVLMCVVSKICLTQRDVYHVPRMQYRHKISRNGNSTTTTTITATMSSSSSSSNYSSPGSGSSSSSSATDLADTPSPPPRRRKRETSSLSESRGSGNNDGDRSRPKSTMTMTKKKQRRPPPSRLSWPGAAPSSSTTALTQSKLSFPSSSSTHNVQDQSRPSNATRRGRQFDTSKSSTVHDNSNDNGGENDDQHHQNHVLWVDKYRPTSTADLSVAPKKVNEIKSWIDGVADNGHGHHHQGKKLLILVGSPGVGKGTAVQVLAETECRKEIVSWMESIQPRTTTAAMASSRRELFSVEQMSSLDSFEEFLLESGSGISALPLTTTMTTNVSKNNKMSKSSFGSHGRRQSYGRQSISASSNKKNSTTTHTQTSTVSSGSLILLEHLPNLHGYNMESRFRDIMTLHLQRTQVPTVLVFSDVAEGKHRPEDLERLIDPDILYDQNITTICQIHPVTKPKMKKILTTIAKAEDCHNVFGPNYFEYLHEQSNGDIRHAIMTFQMDAIGSSSSSKSVSRTMFSRSSASANERDTKLSTFHSLGKLLYAKKTMVAGNNDHVLQSSPSTPSSSFRLAFDPDTIIERSDLGVDGSLRFLEGHAIDFFTDITDISEAYQHFSDASALWYNDGVGGVNGGGSAGSSSRRDGSDQIFPYGCAAAVAGRAVAISNRHPAPNKFRQFSAPIAFDVLRKRNSNQVLVDQLSRRLSSSLSTSSFCSFGGTSTFVTQSLPFLRKIIPELVDPSVTNLYSMARASHYDRKQMMQESSRQQDAEDEKILKEQEEILGLDDIEEYDSD